MFTDPGRVPLYWGYFLDENENRKRRYCLICQIFKPERCHHCSVCKRCVLNMDHHCPWINNCVGFENRKFFILMLTYVVICVAIAAVPMAYCVVQIIESIHDSFEGENVEVYWFSDIIVIGGTVLAIAACIVISNFYKFHIQLILQNTTTIENLDKKRNSGGKSTSANFDMGMYYNWLQVFGQNYYLWPFPIFLSSGKPVGDGVVWPQKYQELDDEQTQQEQLKSPTANLNNGSQLNRSNIQKNNVSSITSGKAKAQNSSQVNDYQNKFYNDSQTRPQNGFNGSQYQQQQQHNSAYSQNQFSHIKNDQNYGRNSFNR